ncbi:MAG TPA: PAS domain S-box protein [Terriglobales bacterium]
MALILAVDDEKSGLYFRKLILEHAGYTVLSATSVEDSMRLFRENSVDLVITDHLLGRKTGTQMSRDMKQINPGVPIILLSGTENVPEPLEHADAFLSKTEGPEELLQTVQKLLKARQASSAVHARKPEALPLQMLLAAIVEDSEDAIFGKTLDGTILTWNKAAEAMYGFRADEIIGRNVSVLAPEDRQDEVREILQRLRNGERIQRFETTRQDKSGNVLQVVLTISPVRNADGEVIAASTIARDNTQTRLAEEALRNSERLAVGGRMAATIAHEINNPLETVTNVLYLLSRNNSLDETARGYLKMADEEVRRVGQITRATLGLYRDRDTSVGPVNVIEIIQTILMLYERRLKSVGAELHTDFKSTESVEGVSGELRQVFSNLTANAIDALDVSGTKLSVRVRDSVDWAHPERKGVRIIVSDDGPGIHKETLKKLFQAFYTTKGQKGTGVGLWVSHGIIAKHGGWIRVRSATGARHGTCFVVFLPAA